MHRSWFKKEINQKVLQREGLDDLIEVQKVYSIENFNRMLKKIKQLEETVEELKSTVYG